MDVKVVLVRSIYAFNVGSVSRVMCNLGVDDLILIDPKCELGLEARQGAANGQGPLENSKIYRSVNEYVRSEPNALRIGLTCRGGKNREVFSFSEIIEKKNFNLSIHLVFGPEDAGLSMEEMDLLNLGAYLPTYGPIESYNLSHAVLLALYILKSKTMKNEKSKVETSIDPAYLPHDSIHKWMSALGFDLSKPRRNAANRFTRLIMRSIPTPEEGQLLEKIIHQTTTKLINSKSTKATDSI